MNEHEHAGVFEATHLNGLANASSAYLRSAMHQPVDWQEWGEAAFARARAENKPILLDIGAVWCHWCHVMDRESYEDAEIAEIVNSHYVAIKVDRDERLDVDTRYQSAVQAMSGQGGWPLTAILTPDGKPFFGGTYFPRDERYGRPGFGHVLLTIAHAYRERHAEVVESAESVVSAIEHNESFSGRASDLRAGIVDKLVESAIQQFDKHNGGFGTQPKFPHPAILDVLLDRASRTGDDAARNVARVTLDRMARGGMYDHLAGGFHRYSVDERWIVPHFEKMSYDNSELLKNYAHSFQSFMDPEHARVAKEIVHWMNTVLSDQERGGFYASQDADVSLDDDGDYFTWTRDEAAAVLTPEELSIAAVYYDIGELGDMHHNPHKNTLHVEFSLAEAARRAAVKAEEAESLLASAKKKLYAARLQRPTPYVDKTIYVNWNGMAISAYLDSARVLRLEDAKAFALRSLERVLREAWEENTGNLRRVVAYGDGQKPAKAIAGMLDDHAALGLACVDAWETTADLRYFQHAEKIADAMIARFYDPVGGGFFDTAQGSFAAQPLGVLAARRKPLQDSPTPAGNSLAAMLFLRLAELSGRADLREKAEDTLETFAGVVEQFGLYAGAYGLALQIFLSPPVQVCVIGEDAEADRLAAATARFAVNKTVLRLPRAIVEEQQLPPTLKKTLTHLPDLKQPRSFAVVCSGTTCQPPVFEPEALTHLLGSSIG